MLSGVNLAGTMGVGDAGADSEGLVGGEVVGYK